MADPRTIDTIIIHCADTYPDMDIGVEEIRHWHVNGNGWRDIGYHYVIRRDGAVEVGRPQEIIGAHAYGHNATSIGVCLVGGRARNGRQACNFARAQWRALDALIEELRTDIPTIKAVIGHNDVSGKTCPTFDVAAYMED